MKNVLFSLCFLLSFSVFSQENDFENQVKEISSKIERATLREKTFLKDEIREIENKLEKKEISEEEAKKLKLEAATKHASAIEMEVELFRKELDTLIQQKTTKSVRESNIKISEKEKEGTIFDKISKDNSSKCDIHSENEPKRTTSQFVFSYGINNLIDKHQIKSLDNSDYKLWKSHFYELGVSYKTRITERPSHTYIKYGMSFLWNLLRTNDNQYQVVTNGNTDLQIHPENLTESKFRNIQLVFPVHLEFDFSKNKTDGYGVVKDRTHQSVRLGLGGFVGANIGTRQKIEYKNDEDLKIKEYQKGDFNTSNFTYGLSSYIAYKSTGLYVKYDLNPLFSGTAQRNVSAGIRFDFN